MNFSGKLALALGMACAGGALTTALAAGGGGAAVSWRVAG